MEDFMTAEQWSKLKGFIVRDPDGWRKEDAPAWDALISEEEFDLRAAQSTISFR